MEVIHWLDSKGIIQYCKNTNQPGWSLKTMVSDRPGPWSVGYSSLRILFEGTDSDWRVICSKRHSLHFVWNCDGWAWFAWSFAPWGTLLAFIPYYSNQYWWSWIFSMQIFSGNIISELGRITFSEFWPFPIFRLWPSLQWWFNLHFYQTANFFNFMTGMAQANIRDQLRHIYWIYKLISEKFWQCTRKLIFVYIRRFWTWFRFNFRTWYANK